VNLSSKFILSITILITIIISLVIFTILKKESAMILGQMQRRGFVLTDVLAMASVNAFLNYDYSTLKRYMDIVAKDEDVISIMIVDKYGRVKMHSNSSLIGSIIDDNFSIKVLNSSQPVFQANKISKKEDYYYSAPIMAGDQKLGIIRIAMSNKNAALEIKTSRNRLLMIGALTLVIGILGAIFMAGMISKPIRRLAEGAKAVSKGDLNWKVNITSKDEFGILSDSFQYMTRNLRKYIESLVKTEKLAVLGQFASIIAHEVRNPMEPIKGSAEILQDIYKEDVVIKKYTQIIKEEISELSSFLDGFLELARPQNVKFQFIDIHSLIKETLTLSEHYLTEHKMRVDISFSENLPQIYGDPQQIKQVYMNLILNAVQAKRRDTGLLKVKSYLKGNKDFNKKLVIVDFLDYGQGIPNEHIDKIFDPFYTTKEEGTGLGLSICLSIIERHSGKIEIESELGQWTLVRMNLPVIYMQEESTSKEHE